MAETAAQHATVTFTDANFEQEVLKDSGLVLIDFWAPWCGPCHMIANTVENLAQKYQGKVKVGKLNVDENPAVAMQYQVMSIPTLMLFKGGDAVAQINGADPSGRKYEEKIQAHLAPAAS